MFFAENFSELLHFPLLQCLALPFQFLWSMYVGIVVIATKISNRQVSLYLRRVPTWHDDARRFPVHF